MILVTGATGDVGGDVLREVLAAGAKARVLARDPAKAARAAAAGAEVVQGDLLKPETLAAAFQGAEKVFLMGVGEQLPEAAANAVAAAKAAGVKHVVLLSSSTVTMQPIGAIGRLHLAAEETLEASGIAWTMLRPGAFASNALQWASTIKAQGAVYSPAGQGKTTVIDPADIAAVGATALLTEGHEGKRYVLTGGELLSTGEQVEIISAAIGKPLRYVDVPESAAREGMLRSGMSTTFIEALLELLARVRSGREAHATTTVQDVTGRPARSFASWVHAHVGAFR